MKSWMDENTMLISMPIILCSARMALLKNSSFINDTIKANVNLSVKEKAGFDHKN